jgi:MFS family permease
VTLLALLASLSLGQALGWTSPSVLALVGTALVGLALIGPIEARQPRPLMPPALFRQTAFTAVIVTCFLQAFACFGTALLGPLLLQRVFGLEPAQMGWLLASYALGMAASGIPGGRLTDRLGGQAVTIISLVGVAAGLTLLWATVHTVQLLLFVPGVLMTGFWAGVGLTAMGAFVLEVSGEEQRGVGMGVYTMVSIMGDIVGVALLTLLLAGHEGADLAAAFGSVYLLASGVALLAIVPALLMRARPAAGATGEPAVVSAPGHQ